MSEKEDKKKEDSFYQIMADCIDKQCKRSRPHEDLKKLVILCFIMP